MAFVLNALYFVIICLHVKIIKNVAMFSGSIYQ